jgi:hypothetical protein
MMGIPLGYYFFLNGFYPGLVDIHPGDESPSKDLKLQLPAFSDWCLSWPAGIPSFRMMI